ncbi:MAG: tryptophan--tRNA ligase [Trueperaceae bacterium]|nr:tryptophan--tRNA ligase [Trueperaceae bacterium]
METHAAAGAPQRPRVFSGMQPTSALHLGNYLGALKHWVAGQHERDNVFCVVDLHAITIPEAVDPAELRSRSRSVAALYLAAGIDPERSVVFVQSHVPEHAEASWLFNCVAPLGWLQRMTQFKSKTHGRESIGSGLLTYPALMAADILLHDTDEVPVGEDQMQHVELTRDLAIRFHHLFGEVFVLPKAVIPTAGARIMGFDDPEAKMSKSTAEERTGHAVFLLDTPDAARKTIMSAVTDSGRELRFEHASPGVRNLLTVWQSLDGRPMPEIEAEIAGRGYGDLKKRVVEVVVDALAPIQARYAELMDDPAELDALLGRGAERARETASRTLARMQAAIGVGA